MKLNVKAMALTFSIFWGVTVLFVALLNLYNGYGTAFLKVVHSIYPGYHAYQTASQIAIGTAYALVDGFIGGAIFAWLYNKLAK